MKEGQDINKDKVGNLSGDEYSLSCIRCGSMNDLHQIAHRNVNKRVIGYIFACVKCEPTILGKPLAEILDWKDKFKEYLALLEEAK